MIILAPVTKYHRLAKNECLENIDNLQYTIIIDVFLLCILVSDFRKVEIYFVNKYRHATVKLRKKYCSTKIQYLYKLLLVKPWNIVFIQKLST